MLFSHPVPMLRALEFGPGDSSEPECTDLMAHLFPFGAPCLITAHFSWFRSSSLAFCLPSFEHMKLLRITDLHINSSDEKACKSFRDAIMAMPAFNLLDLEILEPAESIGQCGVFLNTIRFLRIRTNKPEDLAGIIASIHATQLTTLYLPRVDVNATSLSGDKRLGSQFPSLRHLITEGIGLAPLAEDGISWRFPLIKYLTYRVRP